MRGAHRAFFLNAEERTRFVELLKRVAAFSGGTRVKYLSSMVAGDYIAPVDKDSHSSSRRAYKLTRRGEEAAQW